MNEDASPMNQRDRMLELLADQMLDGLSEAELAELQRLQGTHAREDSGQMERAAAAAHVALSAARGQPMPPALRDRLQQAGRAWASSRSSSVQPLKFVSQPRAAQAERPRVRWSTWTGWLAAAACLTLALLAWLPNLSARSTPAEQRAQLLNVRPTDLIQWSWTATADPAAQGARGDVVWSNARQEGYLTFRGLAPNNPTNEQYQLWIFDKNRPDATPVDGGVFDIPSGQAEVVIAIDPKIQVFDAAMFAVTIEKPGGVVVSKRERIPVLAQAPQQP